MTASRVAEKAAGSLKGKKRKKSWGDSIWSCTDHVPAGPTVFGVGMEGRARNGGMDRWMDRRAGWSANLAGLGRGGRRRKKHADKEKEVGGGGGRGGIEREKSESYGGMSVMQY